MAGARNFNTLLALINNFDQFEKSASDSVNSAGSSLKEQGIIAETAGFKIQQMKNSIDAVAVSFGNLFLPFLKTGISAVSLFANALQGIPDSLKLIGPSFGLALIGFTKFSQQMTTFLDLFDKGSGQGIVKTILNGIKGPGKSLEQQESLDPKSLLQFANDRKGGTSGVILSRTIADIGSFGSGKAAASAAEYAETLKKGEKVLVDVDGKIIDASRNMTKFAAVTRGLSTARTDSFVDGIAGEKQQLGLASLNTGFSKLIAQIVRILGN